MSIDKVKSMGPKRGGRRIASKKNIFAKNLLTQLKIKKLSLRGLSRKTGISLSVLHGWSQGAVPFDMQKVLKLCAELNVDFQFMMTGVRRDPKSDLKLEELFHIEEDAISGIYLIEGKRLKARRTFLSSGV